MTTVVLDTSAVVAGHLSRRGASRALLQAFYQGTLSMAYTPEIIREYAEVLARPRFATAITQQDLIVFLMKLRASGTLVEPAPVPTARWPDPDDLPFVGAALATDEKIIVTLNPADFAPAKACGVHVLSPGEARLRLL
jgi:putative PIN family toxin of toxin-antitoxin system